MIKAVRIAFINPKIYYEDQHLIVLSKPCGLLSQGELHGDPNLVDYLRNYFGRHYVGLIHRLDRNTSGLMVIAKRSKAAHRLSLSLQKGELKRTYQSWVLGHLTKSVHWQHQLKKNELTNSVSVVQKGGKPASLHGTPLQFGKFKNLSLTLVQFQLETGRSHQIRVQAAYEGFEILGDQKYGSHSTSLTFPRMALHSFYLEFPHPMTRDSLAFTDPLPSELQLQT